MIKLKVYLYDSAEEQNGYRGTEYTQYCLQAGQNTEDIAQEVDISEITLMGISRRERFTPSTKFIIDVTETVLIDGVEVEQICVGGDGKPMTYHRIVSEDFVSQPILEDDTYFKHEITLSEPSVLFQHRTVDNFSVTYKLKDVSLQELVSYDLDTPATFSARVGKYEPSSNFGVESLWFGAEKYYREGKYFEYDGAPYFVNADNGKYYIDKTVLPSSVSVALPRLKIMGGVADSKNFVYIGDASYNYVVKEYGLNDGVGRIVAQGSIISNSDLSQVSAMCGQLDNSDPSQLNRGEFLRERTVYDDYFGQPRWKYRKYTDTSASAPTYLTQAFTCDGDKRYEITLSLYNDGGDVEPTRFFLLKTYNWGSPSYNIEYSVLSPEVYNASIEYLVYSQPSKQQVLSSGNPYSALMFIQKAVMNSEVYEKKSGVATGDLNHANNNGVYDYNAPIYIDEAFISELSQTTIVENFYNQKNLWEIFIEAGYYIHAIPEVKFGQNDKFLLTFNRLGQTKETSGNATNVAVYNFSGIDDYIAETDSYVNNLIQLGGYRDEWVAPKSTSEDFIVSNDNVEIIATSPIIELLGVQIRANASYNNTHFKVNAGDLTRLDGSDYDATTYIYEKNVYKILDIVATVFPNKGLALYYENGTNRISGCNYRLPVKNTGEYMGDYSLKKIIYCAFTGGEYKYVSGSPSLIDPFDYWTNIKVNDFSFRIIYRTKSDVRQSHARPDIRKYLLSSKWDKVPTHRQFNNQQDILVDSEKFGSNIYGTLIRTGNNNYKRQEWVSSPSQLKTKGEICRINGEIYYVAKILNTFYTDHVDSVVEYSKDYNQLSKIVGIPSEPRFYEISERSIINRDVNISDYLLIGTRGYVLSNENYLQNLSHLRKLIFGDEVESSFSRYGVVVFKGDKDNGTRAGTFGLSDFYKELIFPLNAYSSMGTLTYEMDTVDNFSAGDKVIEPDPAYQITSVDGAYKSLQAVQYTDQYGKATLFDFYILDKIDNFSAEEIQNLPESPIAVRYTAKSGNVLVTTPTSATLTTEFYNVMGRNPALGETLLIRLNYGANENAWFVFKVIDIDSTTTPETITWDNGRRFIGDLQVSPRILSATATSENVNLTISLDIATIRQRLPATTQTYLFVYYIVGGNGVWRLNGNDVTLGDYGIKVSGYPDSSDTITLSVIADETGLQYSAIAVSNVFEDDTDFNGRGLCIIKDCREQISLNYNLKAITDSDTFVYSQFLFQPKTVANGRNKALSVVFLSEEVNKLSNGYFNNLAVLTIGGNMEFAVNVEERAGVNAYGQDTVDRLALSFEDISISNEEFAQIKSVVLAYNFDYQGGEGNNRFVIARNIPQGMTMADALADWIFQPYSPDLFTNKQ